MKRITLYKGKSVKNIKLYSLLILFLVALAGPVQAQTITLGSGENTSVNQSSSGLGPITAYYANMRFQVVYTATEIIAAGGSAGYIDQLGWNIAIAPEVGELPAYTISMANSTIVDAADHIDLNFTQVFNGDYAPATTAGFDMIELDTPFLWDGVSNVVINICYGPADYAGFGGDHGTVYVYGEDIDGSRYIISDYDDLCDSETDEINDFKPQIQFLMSPPPSCLPVNGVQVDDIASTSAVLSWNALSTAPVNGYDYFLSETNTAPDSETVPTGNTDEASVNLTLEPLSGYYVWVRSNCDEANGVSNWSPVVMFSTPGNPLALPVADDFEGENNWLLVNGNEVNQWFVGDAVNNGGDDALYISNDGGVTNEYDNEAVSVTHAFADVIVPEGISQLNLSFDWSSGGEDGYDYFRVWIVPTSYIPEAGSEITAEDGTLITELSLSEDGFETAQYIVNVDEYAGGNVRFVFEWTNDDNSGDVAAAAIDNISITEINCIAPNELSVVADSQDAVLSWELVGDSPAEGFEYYISESDTMPGSDAEASGTAETGVTEVAIEDLDPLTEYHIWIRSVCGTDNYSDWSESLTFTTLCLAPTLTVDTPDSVCGIGSTELSATASEGVVYWYASATATSPIGMGESITSPVINEDTSFYAEAASAEYSVVGATYDGDGFSNGTSTGSHGIMITTVEDNVYIVSAEVPFTGTGTFTFELRDSDNEVVATSTSPLVTGEGDTTVTVPINILAEDAGNYILVVEDIDGTVDDLSYIDGAAYPFQSEFLDVTSGYWYGETSSNMYLFNLVASLSENVCISDRQMVTITNTEAPEITVDVTENEICEGETTAISVTSDNTGYTYVWTPGDLEGALQTVSPTETTTYTVTATDEVSGCVEIATITVTVNKLPGEITISEEPIEVCGNALQPLTAQGANVSGEAVIGNGTTAPGATSYPNPFSAYYGGVKTQILYTEQELLAQGLVIGAQISSVAFDFNASTANACNDLTIRMGSTANTNMEDGFVSSSALQTVYNQNFTPVSGTTGFVGFNLSTSYTWTGGNLIVEVVHNQGNSGNGNGTKTKTTTTTFESVYYGAKDNVTPAGVASFDAVTSYGTSGSSTSRPNISFNYSVVNAVTWAPVTNLYTDEEGTVAYTEGDDVDMVYFMSNEAGEFAYTATATNAAGCSVTADVTVNVNVTEVPVADAEQTFCGASTVADLTADGNEIQWYADETANEVLADGAAIETGIYFVSQMIDGCESARIAVDVIVNITPMPEGDSVQEIGIYSGETADISLIEVTGVEGGVITWYLTEEDALNSENPLGTDYVIENDATYYAVQTIDGCPSEPFAVTVSVVLGTKDFDSVNFAYWPNPVKDVLTVSYSSAITSATVYNMLGQPVIEQQINALEGNINMANLSEGTYIVILATENATKTIRVVKKQ